jgi:hypothetical protein
MSEWLLGFTKDNEVIRRHEPVAQLKLVHRYVFDTHLRICGECKAAG